MKKAIIILLSSLLLFACSNKKESVETEKKKTESTEISIIDITEHSGNEEKDKDVIQEDKITETDNIESELPLPPVSDEKENAQESEDVTTDQIDNEKVPTLEETDKSNDDIVVEDELPAYENGVDEKPSKQMSKEELAVKKVREYLGIAVESNTKVEFDHQEKNSYVVHVFDIVDIGNGNYHSATVGWYIYDEENDSVESFM